MKKILIAILALCSPLCFGQSPAALSNADLAAKADLIATDIDHHSELHWIRHVDVVEHDTQAARQHRANSEVKKEAAPKVSAEKTRFDGEIKQLYLAGAAVRNEMLRRLNRALNDDDKRPQPGILAARLMTLAVEVRKLP